MLYLYLSLSAALFYSLTVIIEKHVLSDELKDPIMASTTAGFTLFLFFSLFSFNYPLAIPPTIAFLAFISGIIYNGALLAFYAASQRGEISRIFPLIKLDPIIILILSAIFLGESLPIAKYAGILLLVVGAIVMSAKKRPRLSMHFMIVRSIPSTGGLVIALGSLLLFSLRTFFIAIATSQAPLYPVIAWIGFGGLTMGLILLAFHHPRIIKKSKKGIEYLLFSNIISVIAFFFFIQAIVLSSASIVSAVVSLDILFVFVIATVLSRHHKQIISEELKGSTIFIKAIATVIILLGFVILNTP